MTSHAGGNDEQSGLSWYIYDTRVDASGKIIKPLLFLGWDWVGLKNNAPAEIKNNVKPITKTPCKGVPICRKTEH